MCPALVLIHPLTNFYYANWIAYRILLIHQCLSSQFTNAIAIITRKFAFVTLYYTKVSAILSTVIDSCSFWGRLVFEATLHYTVQCTIGCSDFNTVLWSEPRNENIFYSDLDLLKNCLSIFWACPARLVAKFAIFTKPQNLSLISNPLKKWQ